MKAPNIGILPAPDINCNTRDLLQWRSRNGSLRTQDKLRQWDVGDADLTLIRCPLCDEVPDSHSHLFFECSFSSKVWCYVRRLAELDSVPPLMHLIVIRLLSISTKRTTRSIIGRLVLAATSYFIWLERNNRLFKNTRKSPEDIRDMVMTTVRLKLLSFRFKHTSRVQELLAKWNMPSEFRIYSS
ncbi:reverse transcriptase zinc-binding domain-containing protein [Tanacetum coccineum]